MEHILNILSVGNEVSIVPIGRIRVLQVFGDAYNRKVFYATTLEGSNLKYVFKTFPINNAGCKSSEEVAHDVEMAIRHYRNKLDDKESVPVVKEIGFSSITLEDGTTILIQYEPYAGETVTDPIVNYRAELVLTIVNEMLEQIIKPLFLNASIVSNPERLSTGMDFIPRNVTVITIDGHRFYTYVDYFPAKGGKLPCGAWALEYPEPTNEIVRKLGMFRSYNMAGILINFWTHLSSLRPELGGKFYKVIAYFIRRNNFNEKYDLEKVIDDYTLKKDLSIGKTSAEEIEKIIQNWDFEDIFRLRMLACCLAFYRNNSRYLLLVLFKKSHFQDSPLGLDKINEIKEIILKMASYQVDSDDK